MALSSSKTIDQFKSPIRVAAKNLLRSRETQKQLATANRRTINKLKDDITKLRRENSQLNLLAQQSQSLIRSLEALFKRPENTSIELPTDPPFATPLLWAKIDRSGYQHRLHCRTPGC